MIKQWIIGAVFVSLVCLALSVIAIGGGHGSVKPALVLTPFIAVTFTNGLEDRLFLTYILPTIIQYGLYGWFIGSFKVRRINAFLCIVVLHVLLVIAAYAAVQFFTSGNK